MMYGLYIGAICFYFVFSRNNFLDERLKQFPETLSEKCPTTSPVILLMDNINLYRGTRRHLRLFKPLGSKMWNFTGRAAVIPNLENLGDLMSCRETAALPQMDIASVKVLGNNLFICKYCIYQILL